MARETYRMHAHQIRCLSTDGANKTEKKDAEAEEKDGKKKQESFEETLNRLSGKKDSGENGDSGSQQMNETIHKASSFFSSFTTAVAETWQELLDSNKGRSINKSVKGSGSKSKGSSGSSDDSAEATDYDGPAALMIVDEDLGAWEKMRKRLAEAPVIKGILGASHKVFEQTGINNAKRKLDDIGEDAREAWETSQNPWVYRLSSVYDTLTAESEFALATKELNRLDPDFTLEQFKMDLMDTTIPEIMDYFLSGNIKQLKRWLGEAVYNKLSAEIRIRKQEGLIVDPNILSFDNSEILACQVEGVEKGSPIILFHFMCQQINCVRNKDGEVVEGGEDEIRANSYVVALQREYDDENGTLNWKIIDFTLAQSISW
eukprot:CAMPEP_0196820544 /NCGR_PEP_ID=MMETSP1362-20130617/75795_1 /TAXON_ID=163516 /ORGANISM="Leptocylindrus danicus, Strain CCMP1856" /LENGTH=373 /DNA_ID=CAMNT_0042199475 /DNA_START=144 /DNA_END=1262 /DNA_ORIENTATION=-